MDVEANSYNYENPNDSLYCPRSASDVDDNDDAMHDDGVHEDAPAAACHGVNNVDNLVDCPELVQSNPISYARHAKRLDMKKLKTVIWKSVISDETLPYEKIKEANMSEESAKKHKFSEIYKMLPRRLNEKMRDELSYPMAVIALLHLVNEHNLKLTAQKDLADFTIEQDKK